MNKEAKSNQLKRKRSDLNFIDLNFDHLQFFRFKVIKNTLNFEKDN